jgi:catechol 2,3-dioxygenase-like lactoylglutathione lyase family enzyme
VTFAPFAIRMITIDCKDPARLAAFWSAATGKPVVADYGSFVMVGSSPTLGFQQVSTPTPGKNRIHFDGGGADREMLVSRLRELGATEHETHSVPGLIWTVMADPEGNIFCVGNPEE